MSRFLITGLPRSRTAWWSVVATTPVSVCHHEPLKHTKSFEELALVWRDPWSQFAGISDSGVAPQLGRILAEVLPRTLIVKRDPDDVLCSFTKYMGTVAFDRAAARSFLRKTAAQLETVKASELVKTVRFEDLDRVAVVEECFDWLMPGQAHRFRRDLMNMNIQVSLNYTLDQISKPHVAWWQ